MSATIPLEEVKTLTLNIYRFNPDKDEKAYMQDIEIEVPVNKDLMVLDALLIAKEQDTSLSFRRSCGEGVCGSDGMNINGKNGLACVTPLSEAVKRDKLILKPMPGLPVVRDLIVDMKQFFDQLEKVKPYLITKDEDPEQERMQSPEEREELDGLYECILCGCCSTACPSFWWNPDKFLGPAALLQSWRFIADSRDQATEERLDDLDAGHRVDPHPDKRHPFDFVLWKPSKDQEPFWESPWGNGRPGWHIECSAMCHAHLGEHVDIHGGGIDLIFPHHENEIAQSECFTGKSFVSFWMHHNFIRFGEEKMSKSLGNVIKARDYMETYHPEVLKYLLLSVHYRSELSVETKQSYQCISALSRVYSALRDADSLANDNAAATDEFMEIIKSTYQLVKISLNDDFNTPKAFAAIFECVRSFNHEVTSKKPKDVTLQGAAHAFVTCIREIGGYFSLFQEEPVLFLKSLDQIMVKQLNLDVAYIEDLLVQRSHARANKDFKKADDIREELLAKNVLVHDSRDGTTWEINKHFESSQ